MIDELQMNFVEQKHQIVKFVEREYRNVIDSL